MYNCSSINQYVMKRIFILFFSVLIVTQSFGWGATGHRAIGLIAEKYLNAKARKKLKVLLNGESLAMASVWMDEVRSDSTYNYMNDWHWVTIETGQSYDQSKKNPNGDVVMTLERLISDLKARKLSGTQEVEAIKIILHLVGDIHQPLHVGCCDDQGGNRVRVKWQRNDSNLHRVWDSDMIDDTKLSYTELANWLPTPDATTVKTMQRASVRDWTVESMSMRPRVYAIGDGNLGYRYAYKNMPEVKQRLLQAGVRLAGVLNAIYGK